MVSGKLNYTNRKVDGERLAAIVKKDILKRSLSKSTNGKYSPVDLVLSRKKLGSWLSCICDALVEAIVLGTITLVEWHLSDNQLGMAELISLTKVIEHADRDLQELDLGQNSIQVTTEADLMSWKRFVNAVSKCSALRILNLGHNPLGDKAIECLVQRFQATSTASDKLSCEMNILTVENATSFPRHGSEDSLVLASDAGSDHLSSSLVPHQQIREEMTGFCEQSRAIRLKNLGSMSSICALNLAGCALGDVSALHLSYITEYMHHSQSMDSIAPHPIHRSKVGSPKFLSQKSDRVTPKARLQYANNDFSSCGMRLLEIAEWSIDPPSDYGSMELDSTDHSTHLIPASPCRRRSSASSEGEGHGSASMLSSLGDLERARVKVQGNLLKMAGATNVPVMLWQAALCFHHAAASIFTSAETSKRLPFTLWLRILIEACDPLRLLSRRQIEKLLTTARKPEVAAVEYDWEGRLAHVRVWRFLDSTGCLNYGCA